MIRNIFKVAFSNIFKLLSGVLVGFLLPKLIGVTDYGYYKIFTLYSTYVGILGLGFIDGIYLKYSGTDYQDLNKRDFLSYTKFFIACETLFALAALFLSMFVFDGEYRFIFIGISFFLLFYNLVTYFQFISQITSRFSELSSINVFHSLMTVIMLISMLLLYLGGYVFSYKLFTIYTVLINLVILLIYLYIYREIVFGVGNRMDFNVVVSIIRLGFPLMISNLCASLILAVDRQFVSILFETETYAVYAFAYSMLTLITTALSSISVVLYPTMKKSSTSILRGKYFHTISIILIIVFAALICFYPLQLFVNWFLPKYTDSLEIFRIILPGVAYSSVITIVMQNYYKLESKNVLFFTKSIIILLASCLANFAAYYFFGTTIAISVASIVVIIMWYVLVDFSLIRKYKSPFARNYGYLLLMTLGFYLITFVDEWYIGLIAYVVYYLFLTYVFYNSLIHKYLNHSKRRFLYD